MKKYTDPEKQRYVYYVNETLNGFAIQVLNVECDERYPLSPSIAGQNGLALPEGYRLQCCARENAEAELERIADLNGLVSVE